MKELAKVIESKDRFAVVELILNQQACNSCPGHTLCGFLPPRRKVRVLNTLAVKKDDVVEIDLKRGSSLKIAFLVYILPLIMFFLGVLIVSALNKTQNVQLVSGGIFFILTLIILYIVDKKLSNSISNLPKIEKVINNS